MALWLERLLRRRKEAHLIETKLLGGSLGHNQVGYVNRIKGTTQDADPHRASPPVPYGIPPSTGQTSSKRGASG